LKAAEFNWLFWAALMAAILQGITTFVAAKPKAAAYRKGWRTLWHERERDWRGAKRRILKKSSTRSRRDGARLVRVTRNSGPGTVAQQCRR
jgi:hypothetical protein